ncbi:MAG: IS3 family transposase [Acidimicrobiia bacterium]|nr:IS3 family transposase [Acidimicrobiia bacterium]
MARYAIDRGLSQRRAAWLCSTARSAIYYRSKRERRDRHLSSALRIVSRADPAWGYRLAAGYLRLRGWEVNDKRAYRLWRLNGLCLPPYRPSRKIRTGARLEALALRRNDVWAWDFVHDRYHDEGRLRCLTVKDEATGYCLAIKTDRRLRHQDVVALLRELITRYGCPRAIRSDNGSELLAGALKAEMRKRGIKLANIDPGKPWQNGSNESFNATFRRECLNAEIFASLTEARVVIEQWRRRYNKLHIPHHSGHRFHGIPVADSTPFRSL